MPPRRSDLALDRHQLDADDVVGGQAVLQAVHAAGILGDVPADRAGDLARGVGRVIEAEPLHGVGDGEVGDAGLGDDAAVGDVDLEDAVELAHAQEHAVGERQRAPRQRGPGAARDDLDPVLRAEAKGVDDLRRRLGQNGDHRRLAIGGEPVAFEGAQLGRLVDHALARDDAPKRRHDLRATRQHLAIRFRHGDHGAPREAGCFSSDACAFTFDVLPFRNVPAQRRTPDNRHGPSRRRPIRSRTYPRQASSRREPNGAPARFRRRLATASPCPANGDRGWRRFEG